MAKPREWLEFKVGSKSKHAYQTPNDCQPLNTVHHVSHLDKALQVLSDGRINSGLVYDQSKLNTERILVVWLSPNDWTNAGGYRYGNVRFSFDFTSLIQNKNFYWVESIRYGIPAVRILVTDNNYNQKLISYKPTKGDGPWWFDVSTNTHYWNGNYCLEIMFEGTLEIKRTTKIDFVTHHPDFCSINPVHCPDCGVKEDLARAKFLAAIAGQHMDLSSLNWVTNKQPEFDLCLAWDRLKRNLGKSIKDCKFEKSTSNPQKVTRPIGRAILTAYSRGNISDVKALSQLMISEEAVIEACAKAISEDFKIANWKALEDIC